MTACPNGWASAVAHSQKAERLLRQGEVPGQQTVFLTCRTQSKGRKVIETPDQHWSRSRGGRVAHSQKAERLLRLTRQAPGKPLIRLVAHSQKAERLLRQIDAILGVKVAMGRTQSKGRKVIETKSF